MRRFSSIAVATSLVSAVQEEPLKKVRSLLHEMQTTLTDESKKDNKANEKMACWCKESKATLNGNIESETSNGENAVAEAEKFYGLQKKNEVNAKNLLKTRDEAQQELKEARAVREKEQKAFVTASTELKEAISAVSSAVTVLKKHQGSSFLQSGSTKDMQDVAAVLAKHLTSYQQRHVGTLTPSSQRALHEFIQQPQFQAYNSQSSEIFGILTTMQDEFKTDLETAEKENAQSLALFQETVNMKSKLIETSDKAGIKAKENAAGHGASAVAADGDKAMADKNLAAAQETLQTTTDSCTASAEEFAARVAKRSDELKAIGKALEYLESDEAHALFYKKSTSFIQASLMSVRAKKSFDRKDMLNLAQAIKEGTFDKVIRAIDEMVKDIKAQIKTDASDRESCTTSLQELKDTIEELTRKDEASTAKQTRLDETIIGLAQKIDEATEEIAQLNKDLTAQSNQRTNNHNLYLEEHTNQLATIEILNKVLTVLSTQFGQAGLIQRPKPAAADLKGVEKQGGSVVALISQIRALTEQADEQATRQEKTDQETYEKYVQDVNTQIDDLETTMNKHKKIKSDKETELAREQSDQKILQDELKSQKTMNAARQSECDFLLKNFDNRLEHMNGEIEALEEGKSFLKGMTV